MKKLICLLLALLTIIACVPALAEQESKALVLYFDYSENIDTTGLDVDAISQASMAGTRARDMSNLLVMVDVLKERTNADVYSLRVADLYQPSFGDLAEPARLQKENNEMLAFQEELPDFSQYDVIYLGTPVWWYGAPQSILTVLQQADFSGKKIVFFGIHRGSGFAGIPEEILSYQPDAVIVDRFTVECQTPNEETRSQFAAFLDQIAW
jgi:flavodoxin